MRWLLVGAGLILQITGIVFYIVFFKVSSFKFGYLLNFIDKSFFAKPFLYMTLSALTWCVGSLCIAVFAVIDSDPLLLMMELFLVVIGVLILLRYKPN